MRFTSILLLGLGLTFAAADQQLRGLQWAGEEVGVHVQSDDESKAAFAGLEDPMRLATNMVRAKANKAPLESDPALSKAALSLAQDLAKADKKDLDKHINMKLDDRAAAAGFTGKNIKANVFSEDKRDPKDYEGATLAAVGNWTNSKMAVAGLVDSKDAVAGLEDDNHKYIGSAGFLSDSGRAYYASLYAAFR